MLELLGLTTMKRLRKLEALYDRVLDKQVARHLRAIESLAAENLSLIAKLRTYEKLYKIRTGPWKDSIGRWRSPEKHGKCIKTPDPIKEASK